MSTGNDTDFNRYADTISGASHAEIRAHLDVVLTSPAFQGSKRCRQFLEYACDKAIAGDYDALKERTVAVEVFGRRPNSDLAEDTIVRVSAREVRKRLAQFYATPDGCAGPIHIDLPTGSYTPRFQYALPEAEPVATLVEPSEAVSRTRANPYLPPGAIIFFVAALAVVGVVKGLTGAPSPALFTRLWEPFLREPLLIAVPNALVCHASRRALQMNDEALGPMKLPGQRPLQLPPNLLNGSDMIPVPDQYVGFGDMVAATEVASMLARRSIDVLFGWRAQSNLKIFARPGAC